jgi:hypothetical protein
MYIIPLKDMRSILLYYFEFISNKVNELLLKEEYKKDRFVLLSRVEQKIINELESKIY